MSKSNKKIHFLGSKSEESEIKPSSVHYIDDEEEDNPYTITEEMLRERLKKRGSGRLGHQIYAAVMGD